MKKKVMKNEEELIVNIMTEDDVTKIIEKFITTFPISKLWTKKMALKFLEKAHKEYFQSSEGEFKKRSLECIVMEIACCCRLGKPIFTVPLSIELAFSGCNVEDLIKMIESRKGLFHFCEWEQSVAEECYKNSGKESK